MTPSALKTLSLEHVKRLAKSAASATLKPVNKPSPTPPPMTGGNSGVAQIPSLVARPKIPTLSTAPAPQSPRLGEGTAQKVQQTAQTLTRGPQQQAPPQPAPAQQAPVQPQVPQPPLGPLGVPLMSKTGFLGLWARSQGATKADGSAPANTPVVPGLQALARAAEGAWCEGGMGIGKVGNASTPASTALDPRFQACASSTFKRGFVQSLSGEGVAPSLLRGWLSMGLRGEKLASAIAVAASRDPLVRAEFEKLAASPLEMDEGASPLKLDSPTAPKTDVKPPVLGAPKLQTPDKPTAPVSPPAQPPAPNVGAPTQSAQPQPAGVLATEPKPQAGGVPAAEAKPDTAGLNAGYQRANAAYEQAHAKWLRMHQTTPGTPDEAAAWEALPGLDKARQDAHAARVPHMGPGYAAAKAEMDAAAGPYDQLIAQRVPATDPRYTAAQTAWQQAKARHDEFLPKGIPGSTVAPGEDKPSAAPEDPFGPDYGKDEPDQPVAPAPAWGQMFQRPGGGDYHAMDATRPTVKQQEEWGSVANQPYRQAVTQGMQTKLLPWLQQTGGAGMGEWAKGLDAHQKTTVRFGLTDELARVGRELAEVTSFTKDPAKLKEFEAAKPVVFDPAKRPMFEAYAPTQAKYEATKKQWLAGGAASDPAGKGQWEEMQRLEGELKKMEAAGVTAATHHWFSAAKKTGELTQARQLYGQAYAQVNHSDYGSSAPASLKLDPNMPADADTAPGRGTLQQRAAHLAAMTYDQFYAEQKADAEATAEAIARGRHGEMPTSYGHAQWQKAYTDTLNKERQARLGAIPTEEGFYRGRNLLIQQANAAPEAQAPDAWNKVTGGWLRPQGYERTEVVTPATYYPRGGIKTPAVTRKVRDDHGIVNVHGTDAKYLYERTMKGLVEPGRDDPNADIFDRSGGAASFAAGFAQADDATRGAYVDRMSPRTRTQTINNLFMQARTAAQAGDSEGAERARAAAVYMGQRFNAQLEAAKKDPAQAALMVRMNSAEGAQWTDKGIPQDVRDQVAAMNPAVRRHAQTQQSDEYKRYVKQLQDNKDPRFQTKYDPAFGYEFIDRSVLNAGAIMAPVYNTAARGVGAVTGDGPGRAWLDGDTAQMKFIMDNPDKGHLVDWSGKPGELKTDALSTIKDIGLAGMTLLPVGAAANMGRGAAMTVGGLAGSSTAMAGVEMAPIDAKYKPALRVVAGVAGGMGGGAAGGAGMGAAQQAVKAFGQTGMVKATTSLAKVETEVAKLTSAGKPIPADLVAKQTALKTELETMRAAGGEKLVAAEAAQKAALDRVAALEARMRDPSLSPATRSALGRSPEYREAVKALRNSEREMYGVYKGLDAAKGAPGAAKGAPAAGAADDAAAGAAKSAPGTAGNPYSLDAAEEAGKGFLQRWSTGWGDRKAWGEGLDRWTKGLSPAEVLKRRAESTAGAKSTGVSNANLSYNAEWLLNRGLRHLPETVSRPLNAAFRAVATPFRAVSGEGAFFNAFRHRGGRAAGYGVAPFLPYVGNKLDESRVKKPDMTPGNMVATFLPWTNWPAQFATTAHDKLTGAKPGTGMRAKESPTMVDEWGNNLRALDTTQATLRDAAGGSDTAAIKLRRAGEELPGFFKRKMVGMLPSANTPDAQIAQSRTRMGELEAKMQAAATPEEKAQFQAEIDAEKGIIEENKNRREVRPSHQLRQTMAVEDKLTEIKAQQAALVQQHGEAAKQMPQFQQLQGHVDFLGKELEKTDLNGKEREWMGRERRDLEGYKAVLERTGGMPTKEELDPKHQFTDDFNGRQRRAAVEAWKAKTSVQDPLKAVVGDAPGASPAGPADVADEEVAKLENDYGSAVVTGNTQGAKAAYDAALAKAGGDTSRLPIQMFAPPLDHTSFPGMDEAKFGALIDAGSGGPGTFQKYKGLQAEVVDLGQKVQAAQAAGQPVPPETVKAYDEKFKQLREVHKTVQGRAVEHYEQTVLRETKEKDLPAFQGEYDRLMGAMKGRPPGTPMSPQDQDALIALRAKGQDISKKYLDHAMRKAAVVGGFKDDGTPIKTVQDFLGEAEKTKPVLGPDGQPVKQMVRRPDGSVVEQPLTEPASPVGKEIKSRIDQFLLAQVQGIETDQVDAQGRPVVERHVPPEIGAGIFGQMAPMEKMLTFAGLGLGAVGLMGALFGFGGAWMPILGLLGAAFGAHKMTGGNMGSLFKKDFWLDATKSQKSRDGEVLNRFADSTGGVGGTSPIGQVGLDSLKGMPQYADMVAGKMPSRQAVQYLAALQPQDRARFAAELQASSPQSPLLPMIKQVDQFHAKRQNELGVDHAMQGAGAPIQPGQAPKPGQPPAAGASTATTLQQFAAESGVKMNGNLPDLTGMSPAKIGQMVARMPPPLKAEAARQLDQVVIDKVSAKMPGATQEQAWAAVEAAANDPDDKNYGMAVNAVLMRKKLTGR